MARIELSVATDYVPGWGLWHGVREIVANARDAHTQYGGELDISYASGKIRVLNTGCRLSSKALLLGGSTKAGEEGLIGQWGEGLKLALLALTRLKHAVKVRSGSEVWVPRFAKSERFDGAEILVVDVAKGREDKNRVLVEVDGVLPDEWTEIRRNILWLDGRTFNGDEAEHVLDALPYGQILLEPRHKGRVYVAGIWVQDVPRLDAGYNFSCRVELDRDRRMVAEWDRNWKCSMMWQIACQKNNSAVQHVLDLLEREAADVALMQHTHKSGDTTAILDGAAERFVAQYGTGAVPCANLEQARDLEHLGVRGVVMPEVQRAILEVKLGDVAGVHERLRNEVIRRLSWADLDPVQQKNLQDAIDLVSLAGVAVSLAEIDVVEFRDQRLMGQFKDGRLLLAVGVVSSWRECLRTLIHKAAHRAGDDGDKSHVEAIEQTWAHLIEALWR